MDTATPIPPLRRRNSIATSVVIPAKLSFQTTPYHASSFTTTTTTTSSSTTSSPSSSSQSFPTVDFELISIKPLSYTSLKDVLPSTAVNSPTAAGVQSGYEISIRNRLVKQAAWAYLRPMSISPNSASRHFLHRLWTRISGVCFKKPVTAFLRFINRHIILTVTRTFDRLVQAIRVPSSR